MTEADMQAFADRAEEAMERAANAFWAPEPGEVVIGQVQERYRRSRLDESQYDAIAIRDKDGNTTHVVLSTVLKEHLGDCAVGDMVAIKYLGEKTGRSGRSYKDFVVHRESGDSPSPNPKGKGKQDGLPF